MALPDARSTLIDLAFHTCMWVSGFRARPAGSFTWDPTLWWYLLIQRISRVSPAAGGMAHTSYICPAPIRPINGFWSYQFMKLISSDFKEKRRNPWESWKEKLHSSPAAIAASVWGRLKVL